MKKLLPYIAILFSLSVFSQDTNYKEYSYTEFFELIEKEKDTIFKLKDALIKYNVKTDSLLTGVTNYFQDPTPLGTLRDTIIIDKQLELENVFFDIKYISLKENASSAGDMGIFGVFHHIRFKKQVILRNVGGWYVNNSVFERFLDLRNTVCSKESIDLDRKSYTCDVGKNIFKEGVRITQSCPNDTSGNIQFFKNNVFTRYKEIDSTRYNHYVNIFAEGKSYAAITDNNFHGPGRVFFNLNKMRSATLSGNSFESIRTTINIKGEHRGLVFKNNHFFNYWLLSLNKLNPSDLIDAKQFDEKVLAYDSFNNYIELLPDEEYDRTAADGYITNYATNVRYQDPEVYSGEAALLGAIYRHYRENFAMVNANKMYMKLKNFETDHLEYLYDSNPSFDTFFQWKVNQFLKVFSNYGTKPSKAITFSVYVIFVFALIYLFFPNSWDRHGKNRIVDRYNFFFKYMKRKAGIHEVYLEDQKEELLTYEQFKDNITNSSQKVPKFFTATALPLYKWAISGTKLSASFLKRIDIMRGSWEELPASKRIWKSILLIGAFTVSIIYDLIVKVLNALMLSINTFTTLGFGEIPIKGLPRYLAIIQGFIGWFMLTIFSVSLISQLLN